MANLTALNIRTALTSLTVSATASLANGSFVLSSSVIANGTNLDPLADVLVSYVAGTTTVIGDYLTLYLMGLQIDGSTYGDGTGTGTTLPVYQPYARASCNVKVGVTSGTTIYCQFLGVELPPASFKFGIGNNARAWNATPAMAMSYRGYGENLNA